MSEAPPRTARATDRPCELYKFHAPRPTLTQGHHRKPIFLQKRVYGRTVDNADIKWCCGTCHDSIGEWINWLLGEARKPEPEPGRNVKVEAEYTVAWYRAAMAAKT